MNDYRLYRAWGGDGELLYVGKTNCWPRRMGEHHGSKEWFAEAEWIDFERHPDNDAVLAAERIAIETEHPVFNIQHNRGFAEAEIEVTVRASAEVSPASLAMLAAGVCGLVLAARWGMDAASAWWQERRAAREGTQVTVLRPRNPFTEDPPSAVLTLMLTFMQMAAELDGRPLPDRPLAIPGGSPGRRAFPAPDPGQD
jgi:hypothetical protein